MEKKEENKSTSTTEEEEKENAETHDKYSTIINLKSTKILVCL